MFWVRLRKRLVRSFLIGKLGVILVSEGSQGPLPFSVSWGVVGDVVPTVILLSTLDWNVRRSLMLDLDSVL